MRPCLTFCQLLSGAMQCFKRLSEDSPAATGDVVLYYLTISGCDSLASLEFDCIMDPGTPIYFIYF